MEKNLKKCREGHQIIIRIVYHVHLSCVIRILVLTSHFGVEKWKN